MQPRNKRQKSKLNIFQHLLHQRLRKATQINFENQDDLYFLVGYPFNSIYGDSMRSKNWMVIYEPKQFWNANYRLNVSKRNQWHLIPPSYFFRNTYAEVWENPVDEEVLIFTFSFNKWSIYWWCLVSWFGELEMLKN